MRITLFRYLAKEQIVPLAVCFLGVSLILITGRMLQLTHYLFTSSLGLLDLIEVIAFATPKLSLFALPMATLIGVLLAFTRLNGDNELIALRAAGVSFSQFLPAVLCILLLTTLLSFINSVYVVPAANKAFQKKLVAVGRASLPALLKEGVFIDSIPDLVFFFRKVNPSDFTVEGIFVQDQRQPEVRMTIVAERAQLAYDQDLDHLSFAIADGIITRVGDDLKDAQAISFKTYELNLPLNELFNAAAKSSKGKGEMTFRELWQKMHIGARKPVYRFALEFHQRLALPLSCLLLGLAGAPLGALFRPRNRMAGITLGLVVFLVYYLVLSAGKGFGENGLVPPFIAIWTPNMLTLIIAGRLWFMLQQETSPGLAAVWMRTTSRLTRWWKTRWIFRERKV